MFYISTRDHRRRVSSAQAITKGISEEGGLFVPEEIPQISLELLQQLAKQDYISRANTILSYFLTDFTAQELSDCVKSAYSGNKFSSSKVAPLAKLTDTIHVLELWKGPTCAFKDMALQLLPYLLTVSTSKTVENKTIVILVATSGDTGKAALEGFKDVPNTKILVFYPNEGVSPMQKLQMTTQEGSNVSVCAINGNFDDAQNGVKAIFTNSEIAEKLNAHNLMFSSANSINWGRLVPQIAYYFSAYCDLLENSTIKAGDKINVVVPTGNFGNILAAYYAKEMGLPIHKLICASNSNNVLTDFLNTGKYDRNRSFFTTTSPSMDILISSNLERLLFHMSGNDDSVIKDLMSDLAAKGEYQVNSEMLSKIQALFWGGYCDDAQTSKTIHDTFTNHHYLCDTHTAVAVNVYDQYLAQTKDNTPVIIASTASPFKFSADVLDAVTQGAIHAIDEFAMVEELAQKTGESVPVQLASLQDKEIRFTKVCNKENMEAAVYELLGL